jgi:bacteriocin biosynthesis cyclodehydratase domain-containing protein
MILKLDSRYPVLWRTPTSLQVGLDPALLRIENVTEAQERMLAALAVGITEPGLAMIAGGSGDEVDGLVRLLAPALVRETQESAVKSVAISGDGAIVGAVAATFSASGVRVWVGADAATHGRTRPDFAVLVHRFVVPPALHGFWLRRDVPHLPIVFSDTGVLIGPIIEPGIGPCLLCLELHRRDSDQSWPAIASQLLGRSGSAETPLLAAETAGIAARLVIDRLLHGAGAAVSLRIDGQSGKIEKTNWHAHPECGCLGLQPESASGSRPGSDWAGADRSDPGRG